MQHKLEELSPVERKVTVTVEAEQVNAAIAATTILYARGAEVKGFRKGKVPTSVIEQRYRKQIYAEATQDLVNYQLNEIMTEMGVTPISGISVDAEEMVKGQEYVYSFTFEVSPKLVLPEFRGVDIEQEEVTPNEEEVTAVLDRVRESLAEFKDDNRRKIAREEDIVVIDFAALGNDKAFEGLRSNNFQLEMGKGQALEAFEQLVIGMRVGDEKRDEVTFPEDFINPELAGKTCEMIIKLHSIKQKVLPELDDELAKKAGNFENLEAMKESITNSYLESRRQLVKSNAQKELVDNLTKDMDIVLPSSLVERNIDELIAGLERRMDRMGRSLESLGKSTEELREEQREEAENAARTQVFLLAVANEEGITVDPQEVDMELRKMLAQSGQDFDAVKRYYEETGVIHLIKDRMVADKAMEYIYSQANVTEVPAKEAEAAEESAE